MEAAIYSSSNIFSLRRFKSYFVFYLAANKRKLLLGAALILIISFLFSLMLLYNGGMNSYAYAETYYGYEPDFDPFWRFSDGMTIVLSFIFIALSGSMLFGSMSSKKRRLNTIELPASQLEKFLTWWIIYLPLTMVVAMACFWLVDVFRVVWVKVFTHYGHQAHLLPLGNLLSFSYPGEFVGEETPGKWAMMFYSLLILCNSLFALGSALFHKLSFIKTALAGFILMIVFSTLFALGRRAYMGVDSSRYVDRFDITVADDSYLVFSFVMLIGIAIYFLAYTRYREDEIIVRW